MFWNDHNTFAALQWLREENKISTAQFRSLRGELDNGNTVGVERFLLKHSKFIGWENCPICGDHMVHSIS